MITVCGRANGGKAVENEITLLIEKLDKIIFNGPQREQISNLSQEIDILILNYYNFKN